MKPNNEPIKIAKGKLTPSELPKMLGSLDIGLANILLENYQDWVPENKTLEEWGEIKPDLHTFLKSVVEMYPDFPEEHKFDENAISRGEQTFFAHTHLFPKELNIWISASLNYLKNHSTSYAKEFNNFEEWAEALEAMIRSFDYLIDNDTPQVKDQAIKEGLSLFERYFSSLWD